MSLCKLKASTDTPRERLKTALNLEYLAGCSER